MWTLFSLTLKFAFLKFCYCFFALSTSVVHGGFLEYDEPNCLEQKLNFCV